MTAPAQDLVLLAKKFREVESIQHESIASVGELLDKISKFLKDHETPSQNDCTHTVFDNYPDWWMHDKPTFKLAIAEDNTCELLNRYIGQLFDLGIPLTLCEKRTPEIRLCQDVEIWGTKETAISAEELMRPEGMFMKTLGKAMWEMYPPSDTLKILDLVVFDSTGYSKLKGVMKTSIRLVWSGLTVDKERALRIRDFVVHKFKSTVDEEIKALEARILGYNKDNQWHSIFGDSIYLNKNGIRMPLCDRTSPAPFKKPEKRPFKPVGVFRFAFEDGVFQDPEVICEKEGLRPDEWMKIGSIRKEMGSPITEWTAPKLSERAPRSCAVSAMPPGASGVPRGQTKVRTHGGSDPVTPARRKDPQQQPRKEKLTQIEREFTGTVAEFKQRLLEQAGFSEEDMEQDDTKLVWSRAGDSAARVEFRAGSKRVYISGQGHQCKSLLNVISAFVKTAGESTRSTTGYSTRTGTRPAGSAYEPSAVYAPSGLAPSYAPSAAFSSTSLLGATRTEASALPMQVVMRAFESQGAGEIGLSIGDRVEVTHDPEESQHNLHRWVYGVNKNTGQKGWFPRSHTTDAEEQPGALPPCDEASES